jgi:hypothetical protein
MIKIRRQSYSIVALKTILIVKIVSVSRPALAITMPAVETKCGIKTGKGAMSLDP